MTKLTQPLAFALVILFGTAFATAQAPQSQPPTTQKPATGKAPAPKPAAQKPKPQQSGTITLTVRATDMSGNGLADVQVDASGPVARSGATGEDGSVVFRGMRAGTYRLRLEREGFITLEREVSVRAGQPANVSVALNAAPAPPEPEPKPEPAPPPPPPARAPRDVEPRSLSIPDFVDKNFIGGGEPQRSTLLGCTEGGTARVLQIRDPLTDQQHDDADEIIYIVAGSGVVRIGDQDIRAPFGHFVLIPRGRPHTIRRDGRNPVIVLSVLAGAPCMEDAPDVK